MTWNHLPLVEMKELGENASNLLRDFLARNEITVAFRPGETGNKVVDRWYGGHDDRKGVIYSRPALSKGLVHDNVADLKAVAKEIGTLIKREQRIVLLDVPLSTAKALAAAADLAFAQTKIETQDKPRLVLQEKSEETPDASP